MEVLKKQKTLFLIILILSLLDLSFSEQQQSPASHHSCSHGHHHHHHSHSHHHHHHDNHDDQSVKKKKLLPEELAEEEDLKLYGFASDNHNHHHHHHHDDGSHSQLAGIGLWIHAMGCSLLVSLASLICLTIVPILCVHGKPSKAVVDALALFGAGAMLGDAFLHQLPHAFSGGHSHAHDSHDHSDDSHSHSHAHSLEDLSIGLSILTGIVVFLIVEKIVRYVEEISGGRNSGIHAHHHHHRKSGKKSKKSDDKPVQNASKDKNLDEAEVATSKSKQGSGTQSELKKRNKNATANGDKSDVDAAEGKIDEAKPTKQPSNLVFGYLNLFSDAVHNFTDGMALGSAFLLYGSVGGWSRTVFLLAHELPQEVGDFGILVRSGFSVSKALFFNFLSALVALAGTALALLLSQDPGQSSLIEGFTAGGFIYISIAGVLAEMNNNVDYEELAATLMSTVDRLVHKTNEKIESATDILKSILKHVMNEDQEVTWPPIDPEALTLMEQELIQREQEGYLDEGFLAEVNAQLRQAKEDEDKPGLVAMLQKVLQLYASRILSKRSYAKKGNEIIKAEQFLETLIIAPENQWNMLLLNGLTIAKGDISPEEFYAVIRKRIERVLIRTEGGSYQQRILTEYLKGIQSRAEEIVQALGGNPQ